MNFTTKIEAKALVRATDPPTSGESAAAVYESLTDLQRKVFDFIRERGMVIDSEIVEWGYTQGYAESTLRKRRTELSQKGLLELCGSRLNKRNRRELSWQVMPSQMPLL